MPELGERFRTLDRLDAPELGDEIEQRSRLPEQGGPPEEWRRRVAAAVVAVALFATVAFSAWWAIGRDTDGSTQTSPAPTPSESDPWAGYPEGLTELPAPPRLLVSNATVWTGDELILWGGNEEFGDPPHFDVGYAFDPATRSWRTLPPSSLSPRSWAAGVWTGHEVLIWGGANGFAPDDGAFADGAAFDPAANRWRQLAPAPSAPFSVLDAVWTGSEAIFLGERIALAYDPVADSWRNLPQMPLRLNSADLIWTGEEAIAFGAFLGPLNHPATESAVGAAYDPGSDSWGEIAPSPLDTNARVAVWDGTRMVGLDYGLRVAAYDPSSDGWSRLPPMPFNACEGFAYSAAVVDGSVAIENCGEFGTLTPGDERWHVVAGRGEDVLEGWYGSTIDADSVVLLLGATYLGNEAAPRAYVYRPPDVIADVRAAWDVAAAFGALRSHYPYDSDVPEDLDREMQTLLSESGLAAYDESPSDVLSLWEYYPGFEVRSVEPTGDGRYEAVLSLTGYSSETHRERLTIGPGPGLDGVERPFVVLDVEAIP